ncbi:MAG: cupin domain-containing protein [Paraglaciecola sp.]|nr:cupin domain-containing protein [Paraglaciecola sp.]NCT48708.1 cupin domain-containing protein [Paraglaciecola sp.]
MQPLHHFDVQDFLKHYWQQRPLYIKQGFSHFVDPIDENELAGLALEENIDSRLISFHRNRWQVTQGPFTDVNALCKGKWSLLVQGVDQHCPPADALMQAFNFLPNWRMTDLLVSFSSPGAGVGAHIDQYDVFIIQGKGSRRWQVGLPGDYCEQRPHPNLKQISAFEAVIDVEMHSGDILYIPPHHPHNGIASAFCMNYSVGFRAPNPQEMLASLADYAAEKHIFTERYRDVQIASRSRAAEIKLQEIQAIRRSLEDVLYSPHFPQWLGKFLSESNGLAIEPELVDGSYNESNIREMLLDDVVFIREAGVRPIFFEEQDTDLNEFNFYIGGQGFSVPRASQTLVKNFLNQQEFHLENKNDQQNCLFFTQLLTKLVSAGYWYPAQ